MLKQKEKENIKQQNIVKKNLELKDDDYTEVVYKKKKKDDLDISSFL